MLNRNSSNMASTKIWCVLVISWALVPTMDCRQIACSLEDKTTSETLYNAGMRGYDITASYPVSHPDPASRAKIFEPLRFSGRRKINLNSFVDDITQSFHCTPQIRHEIISNYRQYKEQMMAGLNIDGQTRDFTLHSAGYGTQTSIDDENIKHFFDETKGEILHTEIKCISYEINISPFVTPVFTTAFKEAIKTLYGAVENSTSESSAKTFSNFVETYGTHFSRRTQMGGRIIFQKLFANKPVNNQVRGVRNKCFLDYVIETVQNNGISSFMSSEASLVRTSSLCEDDTPRNTFFEINTIRSVRIYAVGSFPSGKLDQWSNIVNQSPVPIYLKLENIGSIFRSPWFTESFLSSEESLSVTRGDSVSLQNFFMTKYKEYIESQSKRNNFVQRMGCASYNDCSALLPSMAENDTCSTSSETYGGVIFTGGLNDRIDHWNAEAIETWSLPRIRKDVILHTLSLVNNKFYDCGGKVIHFSDSDILECSVFDRSDSNKHRSWSGVFHLPRRMAGHTAATIGKHIWFVYNNWLYDYYTEKNLFRHYNLPFVVSSSHCAVSNGTHSFIIGVGEINNEIWLNTYAARPDKWQLYGNLETGGRTKHSCLWFGNFVYVSGGETGNSTANTVEAFNTKSIHSLHTIMTIMVEARKSHQMMVFEGQVAVAGGVNQDGELLDSIETLNCSSLVWTTSHRKLSQPLKEFALVQLRQ